MSRSEISMAAAFFAAVAVAPVTAADWDVTARVVSVEVSYVPDSVRLQIDRPAGTCAAETTLFWTPQAATYAERIASVQAVLKIMSAAQTSGSGIRVVGNNTGCALQLVYSEPDPGAFPTSDWNVTGAHVTWLTGINAPTEILFRLDKGVNACPAGTFLSFNPVGGTDAQRVANANAQLAMLLTARSTGGTLQIYGANSGCKVASIISAD